jgi:ELWxxDGT repeat protein
MSGSTDALNALLLAPSAAPQEGWLRTMLFSGSSLTTLKDIGTDAGPSAPDFSNVVTFGGINYFIARAPDTTAGPGVTYMWRTDGTVDGTYIVPGLDRNGIRNWQQHVLQPDSLFKLDDRLLFTMHYPGNGRELWTFDGWNAHRLKNINTEFDDSGMNIRPSDYPAEQVFPGRNNDTQGSAPSGFIRVGDLVYFAANAGAPSGRELWVTDGTAAGTRLAVDVDPFFYDAPAPKQWYEQALAIGLVLFDVVGLVTTAIGPGAIGKFALGSAINLGLNGALSLVDQALNLDESTQATLGYTIRGVKTVVNILGGGVFGEGSPISIGPGIAAAIDAFTSPGEDIYASGLVSPENLFTVNGKVLFRGSYTGRARIPCNPSSTSRTARRAAPRRCCSAARSPPPATPSRATRSSIRVSG